jgi:hypothetical protein
MPAVRAGKMSAAFFGVAPEKDPKEPEWEVDCVTRSLDGNMLNPLPANDLRKITIEKKA